MLSLGAAENTARPGARLLGTAGPLTIRSSAGGHGLLTDICPGGALPDGILSFLPLSGGGAVGLGLHRVFSLPQLVSQRDAYKTPQCHQIPKMAVQERNLYSKALCIFNLRKGERFSKTLMTFLQRFFWQKKKKNPL